MGYAKDNLVVVPLDDAQDFAPLRDALRQNPEKFPSYIPPSSFAQSIIDVIKGTEDLPDTIQKIREQIKKNPIQILIISNSA